MTSPGPLPRRWQQDAAVEIEQIREALAAAGVPEPFTRGGAGHTVAWVGVALLELTARLEQDELKRAEAARRAAELEAEQRHRVLATRRVDARATRGGCPRPDKAAYDVRNEHERKLAERRRTRDMDLYECRTPDGSGCDWWHVGHPVGDNIPDTPALPDAPIVWARSSRRVTLYTGSGTVHAEGRCLAYEDSPTVKVRTDDGATISWRADLARSTTTPDDDTTDTTTV